MLGPRREVYITPKLPGLSEAMNSAASSLAGWSALFGRRKGGHGQRCDRSPVDIGLFELGFPRAYPSGDLRITKHRPPRQVDAQWNRARRRVERSCQLLRDGHIARGARDADDPRLTDLEAWLEC